MGLNGGGSNGHYANWGSKKEKKLYQGTQNGYATGYSESDQCCGMSKPQKAYEMSTETWDHESYDQSYANYKYQTGPVMPKTQVHGPPGNAYGTAHMQSYGHSHSTGPGPREGLVYGYGAPTHAARYQKNGGGTMGHGFGTEEAYGYGGEYANNGMAARNQAHLPGRHSGGGYGNGFVKAQPYGPVKNMGFEYSEAETREYMEAHFYGGAGGYHGGHDHKAKGLMKNNSGDNSCSDSESDHDEAWISKAI